MTNEEKILTEKYLMNMLTGAELQHFLDKLDSSERFREEVSFYNLIIEGVKHAEDKRLTDKITTFINYRRPTIPFALKMIITFLLVTAGGITIWYYTGNKSDTLAYKNFSRYFLRNDNSKKPEVKTENAKKNNESNSGNIRSALTEKKKSVNEVSLNDISDSSTNYTNEVIEVRKDVMLLSQEIPAIEISSEEKKNASDETSVAERTSEKLNPLGGLPDEKKEDKKFYVVEYWVSPVNYKGYKLQDKKLILFGIDEPDAVKLYSKGEKLWMNYGGNFYPLQQTENYESFNWSSEIIN
jgi:Skp family chaperone for outer membrane proteins